MKFIPIILLLLLCLGNPAQAEIIVVTNAKHALRNVPAEVRLIHLDAPDHVLEQLSQGLGRDPESASRIARERLNGKGGPNQTLQQSYQDVVDAWQLGISKIPAVVVDRQFVVYGEPDVARALADIERFREQP